MGQKSKIKEYLSEGRLGVKIKWHLTGVKSQVTDDRCFRSMQLEIADIRSLIRVFVCMWIFKYIFLNILFLKHKYDNGDVVGIL